MALSSQLSDEIKEYKLEPYVLELETEGLTIVPPEVTGFTPEHMDRCIEVLLTEFENMTGCPITLEDGPKGELVWPENKFPSILSDVPDPTQMLIQQLLQIDRCFRDLCVNPAVDALINHMVGNLAMSMAGSRARRLSSANSFIKWQGDYGYGETLGLHGDQGACPLPWGTTALTANATWCLTDYTKKDGALAYVPGSHKANGHPVQPAAAKQAIAAECPRGSVIVWHGATWHGAFPKLTPGLRLNAVAYYRHQSVLPQENMKITMQDQPWDDCDNPDMMRELIGFDDRFPYLKQTQPIPRLAK
ncbi:MAG: phytanoyl-CoA dioxygenase family protein [Pseudomonadota bacterium]